MNSGPSIKNLNLQVWSNDRIRGCVHQVFMNSKVDRYCLALLSYAGKVMEPEEKLEDEKHPLRYKPFDHYGYLRFFLTEEAVKSASRIKAYCGIWGVQNMFDMKKVFVWFLWWWIYQKLNVCVGMLCYVCGIKSKFLQLLVMYMKEVCGYVVYVVIVLKWIKIYPWKWNISL